MKLFLRCQSLLRSQSASRNRSLVFVKVIRMASIIHTPRDPNTLSNYNNFLTTHTIANFAIDFEQKSLIGNVILNLKSVTDAETKEILLDTSHLDVHGVKVDGEGSKWNLLSRFEPYGSVLKVELEKGVQNAKSVDIDVRSEHVSTL
jgi:leukotriene-A4 hydrolase